MAASVFHCVRGNQIFAEVRLLSKFLNCRKRRSIVYPNRSIIFLKSLFRCSDRNIGLKSCSENHVGLPYQEILRRNSPLRVLYSYNGFCFQSTDSSDSSRPWANASVSTNKTNHHSVHSHCRSRLRDSVLNSRVELAVKDKIYEKTLESREKIRLTKQKFKETKDKMKEKMEEMISKENVLTIPNLLCVTRIILSPVLGYMVLQHSYSYALGIFLFAGVTDLLDGMIARNFPSQHSMIGSFLDPMADKLLICLVFLSLTATDLIPVALTALILSRDLCLIGAGFYVRYVSLPPPKTLSRYFDVTLATAKLAPTTISKMNTVIQIMLVACTLAAPVFHFTDHSIFPLLWYITASTTIASGLGYAFRKDTFKLLKDAKSK